MLDRPEIYLWEIQQELKFVFKLDISPATLYKFLKQNNFRRKKMQLHVFALQRDNHLRCTYAVDVSLFIYHIFLFLSIRQDVIGETPSDDMATQFVADAQTGSEGEHISVIAAMGVEGVLCLKMVRGSVTGDIFLGFIEKELLPTLMTV